MAQGRGRWVVSQTPRLQNSPYFLRIQVRASSQTKGLERSWKQRARLGRDAKNTVFFLSPHTPYGRVRLARFARVRLLRHALPISWLILRKKPTVLQSIRHLNWSQVRPFMTKRVLHNGVVYVKCCIRWCSHCVFRLQVLGTRFDTFSQVPTPEFSQGISARVQGRGLVVH